MQGNYWKQRVTESDENLSLIFNICRTETHNNTRLKTKGLTRTQLLVEHVSTSLLEASTISLYINPVDHVCLRLFEWASLYLSQCLWSSTLMSSRSAIESKYWVSFTSSWSVSRFACAFLNGLIVNPFWGFITKFLRRSSNMIVFFEL